MDLLIGWVVELGKQGNIAAQERLLLCVQTLPADGFWLQSQQTPNTLHLLNSFVEDFVQDMDAYSRSVCFMLLIWIRFIKAFLYSISSLIQIVIPL